MTDAGPEEPKRISSRNGTGLISDSFSEAPTNNISPKSS
eukprot:CAMPEP_0172513948 /NCGR_PEP_ID=MMETSP1066-20121228/256593_1 /TAXON_ID=671091 /ORGANISM="Coscinodiscus wailesii, Strain CCMP2513" /LENGTH=38 /DNA_ID= /DNA_START= /DNA_END= /DNA_ORIENTATION=